MTELEREVRRALADRPGDAALRRLLGELLVERGDPAGEQLALEEAIAARREGWRDCAERLLVLALTNGFARLPDDPDARLLAFGWRGGGSHPVQFEGAIEGTAWTVRYRHRVLSVSRGEERLADVPLDLSSDLLHPEEANVLLHCVSDAIVEGRVEALELPRAARLPAHPAWRVGPCPSYSVDERFRAP
ncbi:MAG: hypothetical protein INH37_11065, partial [Myxococcaceae bacterium]|nr:hypothetical protein [Myxococcaceae bacterium]